MQMVLAAGITGCVVLAILLLVVLVPLFVKDSSGNRMETESGSSQQELPQYMKGTAILVAKDQKNQVTLYHILAQQEYILLTDGATAYYDKYGQAVTLEQLSCGDIVEMAYSVKQEYLSSMQQADQAWKLTDVEKFELDVISRELQIGKELYHISPDVKCFLDGESIDLSGVSNGDILTIQGMNQEVYSIQVQRGHGYLKLENESAFVGGWLEIGQDIIRSIQENMLILVPEGTHQVTISYKGYMDTRTIEIRRNQETVMDVGDLAESMIKYGKVYIKTTPDNAKVYIDGTLVDTAYLISMEYGLHQLVATADGYETLTQYFRLEKESASLEVKLKLPEDNSKSDKDEEEDDESDENSESKESDASDESTESSESSSSSESNGTGESTSTSESSGTGESSSVGESNGTDESSSASEGNGTGESASTSEGDETGESSTPQETEATDESNESDEGDISTEESTPGSTTYKVYINQPEGAEIYLDGVYVGLVPCSFKKEPGAYVVTLRKSGYDTRSYSIRIDDMSEDSIFNFADFY